MNYPLTDVALIEKILFSPLFSFPDTKTISLLSGISPEKMTLRVSEVFRAAWQLAHPIESERMNRCSFGNDAATIPFMFIVCPS